MKTVIIGNSGSGKTWLAQRLAAAEPQTTLVHLDALFWEPGGFDQKRRADEVLRLVNDSKRHASWVVEGVFGELAEHYLHEAQTLIWLDIDWAICRQRLELRGSQSKAHMDREQSAAGLAKLIDWASAYSSRQDGRSFTGHHDLFAQFKGERFRLRSEAEVHALLSPP